MVMVKVIEEEEEEEEEEAHGFWSDLPLELLSLIRSCLFTERDYYIFDLVCKSWEDAPKLRRLQLQFPVDYWRMQSPLLMSPNSGGGYNFFHPLHHAYYMHIPEILNKKILYSKHGWLLIMGGKFARHKQVFFFHPFTREMINLPNLPSSSCFSKFSFSGLPTREDCVVVGIHNLHCTKEIAVIKPGEEDWRIEEIDLREEYGVAKFCLYSNPIFVDNLCYCLDADGDVGVFDPEDIANSMEFFETGFSRLRRASLIQSFLVQCDGELIGIFLNNDGRIFISKLDKSNGNWINAEDLGENVIYLSNGASWAERGVSCNRIYLPLLYDNKAVVYYDLNTGRYHSYGYDFSVCNFYGMKRIFHCTWIKPT